MSYVTTLILQCIEPDQVAWVNAQLGPDHDLVHELQPIDPDPELAPKHAELYLYSCVLNYDTEIADRLVAAVMRASWMSPEHVVLTVCTEGGIKVHRP